MVTLVIGAFRSLGVIIRFVKPLLLIASVNGVIYILPIGDSGISCIASEECDDLVQQCSKKRKYAVKPHPPSEKPHASSEKPHLASEKQHTPSRKPHPSSEKACHPMSEKPHHSSEKPPSQKPNTDKVCHI